MRDAVPGQRGEAVRPVGLGRPDASRTRAPRPPAIWSAHAGRRPREPVAEDEAELEVACHGADRTATTVGAELERVLVCGHDHAHRRRHHRPHARHPERAPDGLVRVPQAAAAARSPRTTSSRPSTCSRTCPTSSRGRRPRRPGARADGPLRHRAGHARRQLRGPRRRPAGDRTSTPTASSASFSVDPEPRHGRRPRPGARPTRRSASRRPPRSPPATCPRCRSTTRSSSRSTPSASSSTSRSASPPASAGPGCRRPARRRC